MKRRKKFCYWTVQTWDGKELQQVPTADGRQALRRAIADVKKRTGLMPIASGKAVCE